MNVRVDSSQVLQKVDEYFLKFIKEYETSAEKEYITWENAFEQEVRNFKASGCLNSNFATNLLTQSEVEEETSSDTEIVATVNSAKENESLVVGKRTSQRTGRFTRQALREPSQLVNQQQGLLKDKTAAANVVVKLERLTTNEGVKYNENAAVQVKKEQMDMPPPSKPIRQTKQTRKQKELESLKIKSELMETTQIPRDSDVIVQAESIVTLVVDTDEEEAEVPRATRARTKIRTKIQNKDPIEDVVKEVPATRSTRTKTRAAAAAMNKMEEIEMAASEQFKRLRDSSSELETQNKTVNKSKTKLRKFDNEAVNKDNVAQPTQTDSANKVEMVNETFVCDNKDKIVNTTIVIEKATIEIPKNVQDLMTDDEDVSPAPTQHKQKIKNKAVFSPYENSPVKKKVEAYEKLGAASAASQMPIRSLRIKKKTDDTEKTSESKSSTIKSKVPKATPGSAEKYSSKILTPSSNSMKPGSALKSSQAAFRERELVRQQKEASARAKKEMLLRAEAEEKRRKLEEKQLKAQQQRDALKKEKIKALEQSERAKQEKIKKFSADQDDKLNKKKEHNAQKYANAARKAAEEKEKQRDKVATPQYLKYVTPLLPTADCYDSDDDNAKPVVVKEWQKKENYNFMANLLTYTKVQNNTIFCSHPRTVNLQEIFPTIEPAKLKRTSSAIWNRSGMIKLASMNEEDDDV